MRHDDEALDLLVAGIRQSEDGPVGVALTRANVHAPYDPVGPWRGRNEEAIALGTMPLGGVGEVDRPRIGAHIDCLDGARRNKAGHDHDQHRRQAGADENQPTSSQLHPLSTPSRASPDQTLSVSGLTLVNFTSISRPRRARRYPRVAESSN
jgi:hypothetical protein